MTNIDYLQMQVDSLTDEKWKFNEYFDEVFKRLDNIEKLILEKKEKSK